MDAALAPTSARVTLEPSGHRYPVEGRETLLQAGLRAGLRLNYGCGNGSCGMCKMRLVRGAVVRTMATDYPLSERERAQGYLLACAHGAATPELTLETLEARGPTDIAPQRITTSVRALRELGPNTRGLHLQTPRSQRLRFLAGQSAALEPARGDAPAVTLPIASCPCDDRNLHFVVTREDEAAFVQQIFAGALKPGDAVNLCGPVGDFVLAPGERPLVFVACDAGFAPIASLIEHALSLDGAPPRALYWLATRADGHFMANHCRAWSEALDAFECALLRDADPAAGARQVVAAVRADLFEVDCDFYLAGPRAFVGAARGALVAAGVPEAQIHAEVLR